MKIQVLAIGTKMPAWVQDACQEYSKRLPKDFSVEFKELPLANRGKNTSVQVAKEKEAQTILSAIQSGQFIVALDSQGQSWSTEKLSENIANWQMNGKAITLLIGGPDGLTRECVQRADVVWSLSALTLPHPLVRVLLIEQLYRAWSVLNNHPYHK
ncbi:MAG: 23S rRNA (pseudouridine(1915)-N(3))-methyltransferase RlmH [Cellvibrionaceae bacterium]